MSELNGFASATISSSFALLHFRLRNQRLSLRLVQAQPGQNSPRFGNLVIDRIKRIGADRAARRRGGNFFDAVKPGDFLDQIHLAFQVHAQGRNLKCASAPADRPIRPDAPCDSRPSNRAGRDKTHIPPVARCDAEQFLHLVMSQGDLLWLNRFWIDVHNAVGRAGRRPFPESTAPRAGWPSRRCRRPRRARSDSWIRCAGRASCSCAGCSSA